MTELLKKVAIAGVGSLLVGGFSFAAIGNDHTGFESENNATIESENEARVETDNDVDLDNRVDGTMLTGQSHSSYNTGSGHVDTGDAEADISATNRANESKVTFGLGDMGAGISSVTNSTTGANSVNNAWIAMENELKIETNNDAHVNNRVALLADTGGNKSSYNTGNGSVSTGGASLSVSLNNTLNSSDVTVH